jgi:adenylate kinase
MGAVALTGTPGTGKTEVALRLSGSLRTIEVGELAEGWGTGRHRARGWQVDLAATARLWRARKVPPAEVVVGHLSHLLPVRDVIVLRCHPRELERRLRRSRRHTVAERHENLVVEATDGILLEAVGLRRRIWEVDTTGRSPAAVAREVAHRIRVRGPSSYGKVDWLSDAWVSEHLLDWSP